MEPVTGVASALWEAVKSGQKLTFALWATSGGLILSTEAGMVPHRMDAFIAVNWPWMFVIWLVTSAIFLSEFWSWVRTRFWSDEGVSRSRKQLDKIFDGLTWKERAFLGLFIYRDERTVTHPASDPAIPTLFRLGWITGEDGPVIGAPFDARWTINDFVWGYLQNKMAEGMRRAAEIESHRQTPA